MRLKDEAFYKAIRDFLNVYLVLDQHLWKLTIILLDFSTNHTLLEGFLSQYITAVFLISQDFQNGGIRPCTVTV